MQSTMQSLPRPESDSMAIPTTRDGIYKSFADQVPEIVCSADEFRDTFLPGTPAEMDEVKYKSVTKQIGGLEQEKGMYGPLCGLLSEMSLQIPDDPLLLVEQDQRWLFFDHSPYSVQVTIDQFELKPDIVALQVPKDQVRSYSARPDKECAEALGLREKLYWASYGAIGELKAGSYTEGAGDHAKKQARVYCNSAARFQPHRGGMFNFIAFQDRFILCWFSLDIVVFSKPILWSEGFPYLSRLVTQIHRPSRPFLLLPDPALTIAPKTAGKPQFHLTLRVDNTNKRFLLKILSNRKGHGRKAFIALATPTKPSFTTSDIRVFRLHWENSLVRFDEPATLEFIHEPCPVPGVVRPNKGLTAAYNPIPTEFPAFVSQKTRQRVRRLMVTETLGKSLSSCLSVKEFLKVIFDAIEVSRYLWEKKHIMHRDISWGNVLVAFREGEHVQRIPEVPEMTGYRFIDQILGANEPRVHCLLADFENAVNLRSKEPHKEGRDITGTPMFIATDRSKPRETSRSFDQSARKYVLDAPCIPNRTESHLTDFWKTLPAELPKELPSDAWKFNHKPIHEAESLLWVLFLFFIRAKPDGIDIDEDNSKSKAKPRSLAFKAMASNIIGADDQGRLLILSQPSKWKDIVHPKLMAYVPMLFALSLYFEVTWHGYDIPSECQLHAHEAMQRLILGGIQELEDVRLDRFRPRDIFIDGDFVAPFTSTRMAFDSMQADVEKSANARSTGGQWTRSKEQGADVVKEIVNWSLIEKLWFSCKDPVRK